MEPVRHVLQLPRYRSPLHLLRVFDEWVLTIAFEQVAQLVQIAFEDVALFLSSSDCRLLRFHLDQADRISLCQGQAKYNNDTKLTVAGLHAFVRVPWERQTGI